MAHDIHKKAEALALLMLGNAPQYVVEQTGVPYATIKRWQGEAFDQLAAAIGPIELGLFDFSPEMDTKRNATPKRGNRNNRL